MDDFLKHIKTKYQSEVVPEFNDSDWLAFQKHKDIDQKRKRRRPFILLILVATLLIATPIFYYLNSQNDFQMPVENMTTNNLDRNHDSQLALDPKKIIGDNLSLLNETSELDKSDPAKTEKSIQKNEIKESNKNSFSSALVQKEILSENESIANLKINTSTPKDKGNNIVLISNQENSLPINSANDKIDGSNIPAQENTSQLIQENLRNEYNIANLTPLEIGNINELHFTSSLDLTLNKPTLVKHKSSSMFLPSSYSLNYYRGIGLEYKKPLIQEEYSSNDGLSFRAETRGRFNYRADIQLQTYYYTSQIMSGTLGIKEIDAPSDAVTFSKAIVDNQILQARIGLDFVFLKVRNFENYASIAYGIQRNLLKEIEYNFEGDNENSMDDDIVVKLSSEEKQIHFGNVVLAIGFNYKIKRIRVFSELSYNQNKGSIEQVIPHIYNINLGVGYRF